MRCTPMPLLAGLLVASIARAQIPAEQLTVETMPEPGENWFIAVTDNGGYIYDGESGQMQGLVSLSRRTPAVVAHQGRREFYAPESYVTRAIRGERTDLVAVYDFDNLSPQAEIEIPNHMARLNVRNHLALLNNGRHLVVHMMNPGHSVSIVDVEDRLFVYEASTPGCAVNLPVNGSDFLQICGDGTLQLMQLDLSGFEENRVRSEVFFDVQEDAVFDRTARLADGWLLITHAGRVFEVRTDDDEIDISEPWSIVPEDEAGWRPGGFEFLSVHQASGMLYVAMHEGPVDSHHQAGDEIWVINLATRERVHRMQLETPAYNLMVTQEANPILVVQEERPGLQVYDAFTFRHRHTIDGPGADLFEDF